MSALTRTGACCRSRRLRLRVGASPVVVVDDVVIVVFEILVRSCLRGCRRRAASVA